MDEASAHAVQLRAEGFGRRLPLGGVLRGHHPRHLARLWGAANLAAILGVVAAFRAAAPGGLLGGWAVFVMLNTLLYASGRGRSHSLDQAGSGPFDIGFAAVQGCAWGGAVALLLPLADGPAATALAAAALAVATTAVPVFGGTPAALRCFVAAVTLLAIAAVLRDGRFTAASLWIVMGAAILLAVASACRSALDELRAIVSRLLDIAARRDASQPDADLAAAALAVLAERDSPALAALVAPRGYRERLLHALGDAVIATAADGRIEYVNPAAETLLGRPRAELSGMMLDTRIRIVMPPDPRNRARDIVDQVRLTRRPQTSGEGTQLLREDGVVHAIDYVAAPVSDERGSYAGTVIALRDVTASRQRAATAAWQARHDVLTSALARNEFEARLKQLVRCAQRDGARAHTLLHIDVDHFRFINDTYGRATGDATLRAVAEVLRAGLRGADTLGRIGNDEFAALLPGCAGERARLLAEELRARVEKHPFTWQSIALPVTVSVGVIELGRDGPSAATALHAASRACDAATRAGGNRVRAGEPADRPASPPNYARAMVEDLQAAIRGDRLELFYQPWRPLAMARPYRHCEVSAGIAGRRHAVIARSRLAGLAERYRLAADIDRWVLEATFSALRGAHPALGDMELVLMTLSRQTLADEHRLGDIVQAVQDHRALGGRIGFVLEAPDTSEQQACVRQFIHALRPLGCRFMLADTGLGATAIARLKELRLDYLGIHESLVENLPESSVDTEAVRAVTRIARALGMQTVAANAATRGTRETLAALGVDYATGLVNDGPRRILLEATAPGAPSLPPDPGPAGRARRHQARASSRPGTASDFTSG